MTRTDGSGSQRNVELCATPAVSTAPIAIPDAERARPKLFRLGCGTLGDPREAADAFVRAGAGVRGRWREARPDEVRRDRFHSSQHFLTPALATSKVATRSARVIGPFTVIDQNQPHVLRSTSYLLDAADITPTQYTHPQQRHAKQQHGGGKRHCTQGKVDDACPSVRAQHIRGKH